MTRIIIWAAPVLAWLYHLYHRTLRIQGVLADGRIYTRDTYPFPPEIYAVSERDAIALGGFVAERRFTVLVTIGRDGDWVSALLRASGCRVVRGSSRARGAEALAEMIADQRASPSATAIVADGPLGPVGVAKPGAALLAATCGLPLYAIGAAARRSIVVPRTWSQLYLPAPFTRVSIAVEPVPLPDAFDENASTRASADLTAALTRARTRALAQLRPGASPSREAPRHARS